MSLSELKFFIHSAGLAYRFGGLHADEVFLYKELYPDDFSNVLFLGSD